MKNTLIGLIIGIIIASGAFYIYIQKPGLEDKKISPVTPIQTLSPSKSEISAKELIIKAFAKKYNKKIDEVNVNISKQDSTHIWGSVSFSGEIGGGWFLSYKESLNNWIIVQDGNGSISCETIAPYKFPVSMVSECVDQNGNLKKL